MKLLSLVPELVGSVNACLRPRNESLRLVAIWCELLIAALRGPARLVVGRNGRDAALDTLDRLVSWMLSQTGAGLDDVDLTRAQTALNEVELRERVCEAAIDHAGATNGIWSVGCSLGAPSHQWLDEIAKLARVLAEGFEQVSLGFDGRFRTERLAAPLRAVGGAARKIVLVDAYGWRACVRGNEDDGRAVDSVRWLIGCLLERNAGPVEVGLVTNRTRPEGHVIGEGFRDLLSSSKPSGCQLANAWVLVHGERRPGYRLHARFVYTDLGSWMVDPGLDQFVTVKSCGARVNDRLIVRVARREDERMITRAITAMPGVDQRFEAVL